MNASAETLPGGVTVAALVKWRDAVGIAIKRVGRVRVSHLTINSPADALLGEAQNELRRTAAGLSSACEAQGVTSAIGGTPDLSSLSALAVLDTSDARELLHVLEMAQEIAERVDAQRGRSLPDGFPLVPGESQGSDLADSIANLCFRLRGEVSPPKGRGE